MTTYFRAISAEGDPESIYYDGRCLWKVRVPVPDGAAVRALDGIKLTKDQFKSYADCDSCKRDNTKNTLFVTYTIP